MESGMSRKFRAATLAGARESAGRVAELFTRQRIQQHDAICECEACRAMIALDVAGGVMAVGLGMAVIPLMQSMVENGLPHKEAKQQAAEKVQAMLERIQEELHAELDDQADPRGHWRRGYHEGN